MTDIFDGDPLIILDADGADMIFTGGQPAMDTGFLNHTNFAVLTEADHWSDDLEPVAARRYKGLTLEAARKPITRQSLIDDERAAEADVTGDEFGNVRAEASNPKSDELFIEIFYQPPTGDEKLLRLERTGQNWLSQIRDPKNDLL